MAASTASTSAAGAGNEQPNTSLYVHNLNTKTKKPELRRQLYSLFSTYGPIISIVATRAAGMRGQAFVVFRDLSSATAARRALDGFEFYERGLRIEYAREKSKATLLEERGPEGIWDVQAQIQTGGKKDKVTYSSAGADRVGRERKRAREEARERGEKVKEDESDEDEEEEGEDEPPAKAAKVAENGDTAAPPPQPAAGGQEEEDEDEDEMDMADSDSDDETGPKPPPA